jgi:hypothetical protein
MNTYKYMRESERKLESEKSNTGFLTVPLSELERNLPRTQPIFYVGTDDESKRNA